MSTRYSKSHCSSQVIRHPRASGIQNHLSKKNSVPNFMTFPLSETGFLLRKLEALKLMMRRFRPVGLSSNKKYHAPARFYSERVESEKWP